MRNIKLIFKREYISRVKNKSFIVMTLLAPLIFVGFYAAVVLVALNSGDSDNYTKIQYLDESHVLSDQVDGDTVSNFVFSKVDSKTPMSELIDNEYLAFLHIQDKNNKVIDSLEFISSQTPSISKTEQLKSYLSNDIFRQNLIAFNVTNAQLKEIKPKVNFKTLEAKKDGELKSSNSGLKSGVGMMMAFIIYMFIFIYGAMVMRSTIEEKTNRIVEVIVSSVKPFHLMLGKILGVAAVGLTQFILWIVLATGLISVITLIVGASVGDAASIAGSMPNAGAGTEVASSMTSGGMPEIMQSVMALPFAKIITVFLLFFVGGYLLYSSMFAAIGSAVNQDSDAQQFMFPVSMPLIFGFIIAQSAVFQDPNGTVATIFSYIPFTSPVVMCARAAFGVSWIEIFTSFLILVGTFLFMVWLSARIYRVGILMYGKKPKWKDFAKWIVRKN